MSTFVVLLTSNFRILSGFAWRQRTVPDMCAA
jgi:hypothetical protein